MEFHDFYMSKIGEGKSSEYLDGIPVFNENHEKNIFSRKDLVDKYDYGLAIARGGLFAGYCFQEMGLPVKIVESKRTLNGVIWNEVESLENLANKRVLIFDQDVISGKTLRKAKEELSLLKPSLIGVFLNYRNTSNVENVPFEMNKHFYDLNIIMS